MPTWWLWRALRYPPASPLLRMRAGNVPLQPTRILPRHDILDGLWPKLVLAALLLLILLRFGVEGLLMSIMVVPGGLVLVFLGLPLLMPLASIFLGSYWSADISRNIRRERALRTWDLLCAAPPGTPGASHVITSRCLLRRGVFSTFQFLHLIALGLCLGALFLMGAFFVVMVLRGSASDELVHAFRTLLDLTAIVVALWLHWQQTVVLAALTGLLLASSEDREAPWFAPIVFPALQLGSWALFAVQLHLLGPLSASLTPENWLAWSLLPLGYLALFLLPREALVLALLRFTGRRLQTEGLFSSRWWQNATAQTG